MAFGKRNSKTSGAGSFALIVGDEGAILVQMHKKRVLRRLFAGSPDPAQTRGMREALDSAPKAPITMLVDMMDQSYVRQTLPPVSSFSVGKIVRRRLEKDLARDDVKGYLVLDREKTGRRDWNYLMVSLANSDLLQKWIAFLVERSNLFRGIGLVPLESQAFINAVSASFLQSKEDKPREWQILVSHHKVGGFRQIVLKNGKLIFTRMAQPIGESNPEVIAGNIEQEIINTQEYLKRMGLQDPSTLCVTILASNDIKQLLDPKNIKAGEHHFLTPSEMAERLLLTGAAQPEDHFGDVVVTAFIGRKGKLTLPLNTPYTEQLRRLVTYIRSARAVAVLALLCITGWAAASGWDILSARSETLALANQQQQLQAQLTAVEKQAKLLPKEVNRYADIIALQKALARRPYDPLHFVITLSQVFAQDALVKDLDWTVSDPLANTLKDGEKRLLQADVTIRLAAPTQPRERYIASARTLIAGMRKAFPEFDVANSELPGLLSETKELKTVLGDAANPAEASPASESDTVKFTVNGPVGKAGKNGQ